jgi:hypothetical protein
MAPKCGSTTIKNSTDGIAVNITDEQLNNPIYKKIIIIRKSVIDRFLSGFYEDLFNNYCYDTMDITFNNYLLFLHKCYRQKSINVNNVDGVLVWYGNCSNVSLNITDNYGNFCSHIMSQHYAISSIINRITCKNANIIELSTLSDIVPKKYNVKVKVDISADINTSLSYIKATRLMISEKVLTEHQREIILDIYKEDLQFLNQLEQRFDYVNKSI